MLTAVSSIPVKADLATSGPVKRSNIEGQLIYLAHIRIVILLCQVLVAIISGALPSEAEKPGWRVGIANRKVFARLESFCALL